MRSSFMVMLTLALLALVPAYAQSSNVAQMANPAATSVTVPQNAESRFTYSHETPMECYACHHTAPDIEGNGHGGRTTQIIS